MKIVVGQFQIQILIPNDQIRIGANGDAAFAWVQAIETRCIGGSQRDKRLRTDPSFAHAL
jgi:hypothetical protein